MIHITNEELHILENMNDAEIGEKMGLVKFIRRLSLDLLDARKLIDEQKALIREMVAELKDIESLAETRTMKGELVYVSSFIEIRDLLEKSNGYV